MVVKFLAEDLNLPAHAGERTFDSMQSLALNPHAWRRYVSLDRNQRSIVREALIYPFEVTIANILRYTNFGVVIVAAPPPPAAAAVPAIRRIPRINNHNIPEFKIWVVEMSEIIRLNAAVRFNISPFIILPNRNNTRMVTYSSTIQISLHGNIVVGTSFVCHLHPDASAASVGNPGSSRLHLKPSDTCPTPMRIDEDNIPNQLKQDLLQLKRAMRI